MAIFQTRHVSLRGISACVPARREYNRDYNWVSEAERNLLIKTTGIDERRVVSENCGITDLAVPAAEKLLHDLGWNKNEIDLLVLVTQSRDYLLPSSAVILQDKIGLSHQCAAFDIGLGCSGYVYGLSVAMSMLQNGGLKKCLLVAGDVSTVSASPEDKSVYPLFGDAVTVTALEHNEGASPVDFNLQSDGSGYEAIILRDGSIKGMPNVSSFVKREIEKGIVRSRRHLELNGLDVFNFSVREAPLNVSALLQHTNTTINDYDFFVMHQANKLMNETIRKKLKAEASRTPYSLGQFGNTSSASIPLTILTQCSDAADKKFRWLLSGFGVGLSWGTCTVETDQLVLPAVIDYE